MPERSVAEILAAGPPEELEAFLASLTLAEIEALQYDWSFYGRPSQQWPDGDWTTWFIRAGRGFGKTATGSNATQLVAMSGEVSMLHLIAPTPADYRDVMIEGPAGLMRFAPPDARPEWFPSKRQLVWPNGVKALCFCVTPDTEALTRERGWVTHDALAPGDEILTWNAETGSSEWQPTEDVHRFGVVDEPMIDIGASRTTETHRWPYLDRTGRVRWTTSAELAAGRVDSHARLVTAAPNADAPPVAKLDDALVELRVTRSTFTGTVWCPQTANRTWFARRHGQMFVTGNSAEDPEALRGPQCGFVWGDEPGAWTYGEETFDQAQLGLRLTPLDGPVLRGAPRQVLTTTPKPYKWLTSVMTDPHTHLTLGTTYDNLHNLAPAFANAVIKRYEGTMLGRQELLAELVEAVEGALWTPEILETTRRHVMPETRVRIAVGVDPAVTAHEASDETGIVVAAVGDDAHGYVLEDATPGRVSPAEWARAAVAAYHRHHADVIVAEVNNGGDLVAANIRTVDPYARVELVRATRGKARRAQPVAALFEQDRAHLLGSFPLLEEQLVSFVDGSPSSPDRMDAMVWALTHLLVTGAGAARLIA